MLPFHAVNEARLKKERMLVRRLLTMHNASFARGTVFSFMAMEMPKNMVRASTYRIFAKLFRSCDVQATNLNLMVMEALAKSDSTRLLNCYVNSFHPAYCAMLESWN